MVSYLRPTPFIHVPTLKSLQFLSILGEKIPPLPPHMSTRGDHVDMPHQTAATVWVLADPGPQGSMPQENHLIDARPSHQHNPCPPQPGAVDT